MAAMRISDLTAADLAVLDSRIKACEQALNLETPSQKMRDRWISDLAALRRIRSALTLPTEASDGIAAARPLGIGQREEGGCRDA